MSVYRDLGFAAWAGQEPEPSTVEPTTPEGNTFTATPGGDRCLVDTSVDPGGSSVNRNNSAVRTLDMPPACVTATVDPPGTATRTVRVTYRCAVQQRVKALVAFSDDIGCLVATHASTDMIEGVGDPRSDRLAAR